MDSWRIGMGNETLTTSGLVLIARTDFNSNFGYDGPLRVVRRRTTFDTYRVSFCNELRNRKQLRHRFERAACIILIKSRHDHAFTLMCQSVRCVDQAHIEKL